MAQYKGASREAHRARTLEKRRERQKEEMELLKNKLSKDLESKGGIVRMGNKFQSHFDAVEQELKSSTIGLVTLNEMKAKQETIVQEHEKRIATETKESERRERKRKKQEAKEKAKQSSTLSFDLDEDVEEEEVAFEPPPARKITKNPDVDTSFLPDREREEQEKKERERLRQEWVETQKRIKEEEVEVTYSYWDGSGHRKTCKMRKGDTIQKFLQKCLLDLRNQFTELRAAGVEHLMYVKEDLIIPHHYTFYDFIVTKARGKSGPLFSFDAYDDIRIKSDSRIEKDESHAGKVVLRSWYEKHKHIFPASRWEPYDPEKKWEKYTVADKEGE
ncbi:protein FAM50A-like [Rhopilema esculentum]|uniref:protein FAM50A-like n=1 Tax=Rhopilema esculentum TaxID=499914 RepID=UPI0031D4691C